MGLDQLSECPASLPSCWPEFADILHILIDQSKVVSRILNDTLTYTRMEDGGMKLEYAPFCMEEMLKTTVRKKPFHHTDQTCRTIYEPYICVDINHSFSHVVWAPVLIWFRVCGFVFVFVFSLHGVRFVLSCIRFLLYWTKSTSRYRVISIRLSNTYLPFIHTIIATMLGRQYDHVPVRRYYRRDEPVSMHIQTFMSHQLMVHQRVLPPNHLLYRIYVLQRWRQWDIYHPDPIWHPPKRSVICCLILR